MSAAEAHEEKHEIIVVKHGGGDHEDGHHGGVWKIAFADFMTAMMCFFLVMWLINAANEQTKAAVASYFNPVKLIDRNARNKGLEDTGDGPQSVGMDSDEVKKSDAKGSAEGTGKAGPATEDDAEKTAEESEASDAELFENPYAVLAEIAAETGVMQNISDKGDGGAQLSGPATGASGGESYRDPFAPDFWSQEVMPEQMTEPALENVEEEHVSDKPLDPEAEHAEKPVELAKPVPALEPKAAEAVPETEKGPSAEALATAKEIRQELAAAFKPGEKLADGLSVVADDKGVTISVTDQLDFGMYEIGSALPRRELVLAMEKIAATLDGRPGKVVVGGHTDARPFKSKSYDNWRLSSSRAQSA